MSAAARAERLFWENDFGWSDLEEELDCWRAAGRSATLWWRDDDAVAPSPALDRLLRLAGTVPLALAVIPALVEAGLADWLTAQAPAVSILQHGWRHANHAGEHGKKSEFPPGRPAAAVAAELAAGRERLAALFGARALPVLAPPWNRFDEAFLPLLSENGLLGLSCLGPRPAGRAAPGIALANVQLDLIAWRVDRGFLGTGAALAALIGHLRERRLGRADPAEPTGILTHHLVQDGAAEAFLRQLVMLTGAHPAVRWLDAVAVFSGA